MSRELLARRVIEDILEGKIRDRRALQVEKLRLCRELGLSAVPSSPFILSKASPDERETVLPLLLRKPTRTASGVAVVAVQTSPSQTCPGRCIYCPDFPGASKSYTGLEPASMRAVQCAFDPYLQVSTRLAQLSAMGHPTSKVELIVQGGTFTAMDLEYRRWFLARCLDAMIDHGSDVGVPRSLSRAMRLSETSPTRPVGITFETRPDWIGDGDVRGMLEMGGTRVEVGVQTLSDRVYREVARGHTVADVARAFSSLRRGGMKICAHMMLGLPGSDEETDLWSLRTLFTDPDFKPDELKIYPTLVIGGTELYRRWRAGSYEALTDEEVLERLVKIKELVPPWVRIKRVMRDIPAKIVAAGPRRSDMRNLALAALRARGKRCRCIRCREIYRTPVKWQDLAMREERYEVTGGEEVFLSFEDARREALGAFLRLSLPTHGPCRVRELHTYGRAVEVGRSPLTGEYQHRGMGRSLLEAAEDRARENGGGQLLVTSGIGARDYYRALGYHFSSPYMVKDL